MVGKMETFIMFLTGGVIYFYFEIFVRGYSHISMFLLGGVCFSVVGKMGEFILKQRIAMRYRLALIMLSASCIITVLELITGIIVNKYMDLLVWDYSSMQFNYMGQICLLYSLLWALLGLPCVFLYSIINRFVIEVDGERVA